MCQSVEAPSKNISAMSATIADHSLTVINASAEQGCRMRWRAHGLCLPVHC